MTGHDIHQRLQNLDRHLTQAETWASRIEAPDPDHTETANELRRRYAAISAEVAAAEDQAEAQGHHVTDLEHAVRMWLDRLSRETA